MSSDLPTLRRAHAADLPAIRALLTGCGLPAQDLDDETPRTLWVAEEGDGILGVVAVEGHGPDALLRSLAVEPAWRRLGIARALVERAETEAMVAGTTRLLLLTETAAEFFARLGYAPFERGQAPANVAASSEFRSLCPAGARCFAKTLPPVIYHNPLCGTSRTVLGLLREAGIEPRIVEYLKTPPDRRTLQTLIERNGHGVRALLRQKGTNYDELKLGEPHWSDEQLLDRMLATPLLINRPIVVTARGARLCRPSQSVLELIPPAGAGPAPSP